MSAKPTQRRTAIVERLSTQHFASVAELAQFTNSSTMTVRRDLEFLHQEGLVARVRGGARRQAEPFAHINERHSAAPSELTIEVLGRIRNGTTIGLIGGSAATAIARQLAQKVGLTVVTNTLGVAKALEEVGSVRVILTGGTPNSGGVLTGPLIGSSLSLLAIEVLFIAVIGIDPQGRLTVEDTNAAAAAHAFMLAAKKTIAIAELASWRTAGAGVIAEQSSVHELLLDNAIPRELEPALTRLKGKLTLGEPQSQYVPSIRGRSDACADDSVDDSPDAMWSEFTKRARPTRADALDRR